MREVTVEEKLREDPLPSADVDAVLSRCGSNRGHDLRELRVQLEPAKKEIRVI